MESTGRKIMYVGLQLVPSSDRPNARPDRIWNGPGDVVDSVPPIQAHALCQHKTEWVDVTSLDPEKLADAQRAARAFSENRVRELKNPKDAPNNQRNIDAFTTDDLEAELRRRRALEGDVAAAPAPAAPAPKPKNKPKASDKLAEQVGGAVERVLAKVSTSKETTLLDDEGIPTLAAVQEELGYSLSEDEYRTALGIKA